MLQKLKELFKGLCNRISYSEGKTYALDLLKDGWSPADLRCLPALCPTLMPSAAYADGFFDTLKKWEVA